MSQAQDKDLKNDIIVAESGGESPVRLKEPYDAGADQQVYTEPKKTWKSFFWSCKHPVAIIWEKATC